MTYTFEIHYTFGKGKGTGFVNAETVEAAEAAFRAEYPATPRFDYKIIKVVAGPVNFRRIAV